MIAAIDKNLQRGITLLTNITNEQYSDKTVAPYYSSIGAHMRHVLDVFSCIVNGVEKGHIDFSDRKRNTLAEEQTVEGIKYFEMIIQALYELETLDLNQLIEVTDDLGMGRVTATYTLSSALIQAHSHAIHHFASVGFIVNSLGIELPDADFGYNPTTPRVVNK
ncbi:conserved hypothetical protein [Tenacibaculum litopenaei]|uniref:DinB family protein n=1 Tax=Tenacibaculum litopenaei TaxID=396016 RepID=UPI0038949AEB